MVGTMVTKVEIEVRRGEDKDGYMEEERVLPPESCRMVFSGACWSLLQDI